MNRSSSPSTSLTRTKSSLKRGTSMARLNRRTNRSPSSPKVLTYQSQQVESESHNQIEEKEKPAPVRLPRPNWSAVRRRPLSSCDRLTEYYGGGGNQRSTTSGVGGSNSTQDPRIGSAAPIVDASPLPTFSSLLPASALMAEEALLKSNQHENVSAITSTGVSPALLPSMQRSASPTFSMTRSSSMWGSSRTLSRFVSSNRLTASSIKNNTPIPQRRAQTPGCQLSRFSTKKNEEIEPVVKKVNELLEAPTQGAQSSIDIDALTSGLKNLNMEHLTRLFAAGDRRDPDAGAKKGPQRVNLKDRPLTKDENKFRGQALSKLERLRKDDESRNAFFKSVEEAAHERREEKAHLYTVNIVERNKAVSGIPRAASAQTTTSSTSDRFAIHRQRLADAKIRKKEIMDTRREHFSEMVEKTRGMGFVMDDSEISPKVLKQQRSEKWAPLLVHYLFLAPLMQQLVYSQTHKDEIAQQKRAQVFAANVRAIQALQKWWRRAKWAIFLKRKNLAAERIRNFLRGIDKVKVHFALAMGRMIKVVRKLQAKFRAVRIMRRERRLAGVHKIFVLVEAEAKRCDAIISKCKKEAGKQNAQAKAAIKARKGLFEAKALEAETKGHEAAKRKAMLRSLTHETAYALVDEVVLERENQYNELLLQYGKQLFDKFQAQFNAKKLGERKISQYNAMVAQKTIAEIRLHRESDVETQYRYKKVNRPFMRLYIDDDDAQMIFDVDVTSAATEDFLAATQRHYGSSHSNNPGSSSKPVVSPTSAAGSALNDASMISASSDPTGSGDGGAGGSNLVSIKPSGGGSQQAATDGGTSLNESMVMESVDSVSNWD